MIIHFERSGGFAGIIFKTRIDVNSLPPEEAEEVIALVENSGIKNILQESVQTNTSDQFSYVLMIESESEMQSFFLKEQHITSQMKPLIDYLNRKARGKS